MSPRKSCNAQLGSQEKLPRESGGRKSLKNKSWPPHCLQEALSDYHLDLNQALLTLLSFLFPYLSPLPFTYSRSHWPPELVPDPTGKRTKSLSCPQSSGQDQAQGHTLCMYTWVNQCREDHPGREDQAMRRAECWKQRLHLRNRRPFR